jgi:hypothetical protein
MLYEGQKAEECAKNKIIDRGDFLIGSRLDSELYGSSRSRDPARSTLHFRTTGNDISRARQVNYRY